MTDRPELRDCPSCGEPVGRYSLSCPKCGTNWQVRFLWKYYVPALALLVCLSVTVFALSKACQTWEADAERMRLEQQQEEEFEKVNEELRKQFLEENQ
jgi:uncharacterized membrane protein (DUF106 family)